MVSSNSSNLIIVISLQTVIRFQVLTEKTKKGEIIHYVRYVFETMAHTYEVHTISFQTFFIWVIKIVVDSWKFSMSLLYILCDDWQNFMISGSNQQLQQQLEYTLLKPDCHIWWISKEQSDALEERYAIKFCFKLGKNATETYGILQTAFRPTCMNRASVFSFFLLWIRVSDYFLFSFSYFCLVPLLSVILSASYIQP